MQTDAKGRARYFPSSPETGAKRMANYRLRHPERVEAYNTQRRERRQALKAAARAQAQQLAAVSVPLLLPAPPVRLCLPAPAEQLPLFILDERTPEPVLVEAEQREQKRQRRAA